MADQKIEEAFKSLSIKYDVHKHDAVMNVEELVKAVGGLDALLAKNLFVKDKKKRLFLIVAKHDRKLDLKKLSKQIVSLIYMYDFFHCYCGVVLFSVVVVVVLLLRLLLLHVVVVGRGSSGKFRSNNPKYILPFYRERPVKYALEKLKLYPKFSKFPRAL